MHEQHPEVDLDESHNSGHHGVGVNDSDGDSDENHHEGGGPVKKIGWKQLEHRLTERE